MVGVPARVQAARYAGERGIGLRRACNLFGVARSMTTYRHLQPEKDKPMVEAITEVSRQNTSWGAPLIHGWRAKRGILTGSPGYAGFGVHTGSPRSGRRSGASSGQVPD